jgi:uncharacterized protein YbjT (DUF2867 family)
MASGDNNQQRIFTVIGATGRQGFSVASALLDAIPDAHVRALMRLGASNTSLALRLKNKGGERVEFIELDLNTDHETLKRALAGAYGVYAHTFFEDDDLAKHETETGERIARFAREANVRHFVWSTLPHVENVPYFANKAKVDALIKQLQFDYYTFVGVPFCFQNFTEIFVPERRANEVLFRLPMRGDVHVLHIGDIHDVGKVAAGAFLQPHKFGNGQRLFYAADLVSVNDVMATLSKKKGRTFRFEQVSPEEWLTWKAYYNDPAEWLNMCRYLERNSHFGPDAEHDVELARQAAIGPFKSLEEWVEETQFAF